MKIYTVVMLVFALALAVPGLLLCRGTTGWLYSFERAKYKDKSAYAGFLGRSVFIIAVVFALSGLISVFSGGFAPLLFLLAGLAGAMIFVSKKAGEYYK